MNVSDTLNQAADLIEDEGWTQYKWKSRTGERCIMGAIRDVAGVPELAAIPDGSIGAEARNAIARYLWYPPSIWNDQLGRTAEEVVEALRSAALIEGAKAVEVTVVTAVAS